MKALLRLEVTTEGEDTSFPTEWLCLNLLINGKRNYQLASEEIDSANYEKFTKLVTDMINEVTIILGGLPLVPFSVDDSVIGFVDGKQDEIEDLVSKLILEL